MNFFRHRGTLNRFVFSPAAVKGKAVSLQPGRGAGLALSPLLRGRCCWGVAVRLGDSRGLGELG